ncbi:hypothetical protein BDV28DRAFT_136002 [Aspergillus coremiiformis]|uniref:Uncharacterized protein n=1 Tax=Aspergillus coremiiformis TaxID=138285 RepID=A0A5N6Z2S7_9EURO|nr:hypothetical protein BDV28DRAFT_136002 [Aspergillus coremiiformis]
MRICLLQVSPNDSRDSNLDGVNDRSDLARYTDQHVFEDRFIRKHQAKQDLNLAVAESFDLYINYLWGGREDGVAGVDAVKYLKSLDVPFIGLPSHLLEDREIGFCKNTGRRNVPLIVRSRRPSGDKAGLVECSVCADRKDGSPTAAVSDYRCTVIEMGNTPVALSPTIYPVFLTGQGTALSRVENPSLYDGIRQVAEEAFYSNDMHGCSWCTVHIHTDDGTPSVIGIDLMPPIFLSEAHHSSTEDEAIRASFPGGHRALINTSIATYFLRHRHSQVFKHVGIEFDEVAPRYDALAEGYYINNVKEVATKYAYDGTVLDLACGTGLVGRFHGEAQGLDPCDAHNASRFIGVDVSLRMRDECLRHGWYHKVLLGPMQRVVTAYPDAVDHVICMGALQYLDANELSLVFSRVFQLARRSFTFSADEIPESYNDAQRRRGRAHMHSIDHLAEIEAYGIPVGWKMTDRWRRIGWKSPTSGDEVYTTIFRFERI